MPDDEVAGGLTPPRARRRRRRRRGAGRRSARLVAARVRTAPLRPVARLAHGAPRDGAATRTGRLLAEVVDDEVSVLDGRQVAARFREVEVELAAGGAGEALLDDAGRRACAPPGPAPADPTPKVAQALGPARADAAGLGRRADSGDDPTAADVVQAGHPSRSAALLDHDPVVRLGDDPEGVHQMRVGDPPAALRPPHVPAAARPGVGRAAARRAASGWPTLLGAVRDADVLLDRLAADVGALDAADREPRPELLDRAGASERDAGAGRAARRARRPTATSRCSTRSSTPPRAARSPPRPIRAGATRSLPALVGQPVEAAAQGGGRRSATTRPTRSCTRSASGPSGLGTLPRRRRSCVGKPAPRFAKAVADVQDVLGDHQDAVVAERWLRDARRERAPTSTTALVAGQLIAVAASAAADAHARRGRTRGEGATAKTATWLTC